jgi:hypothetical protein
MGWRRPIGEVALGMLRKLAAEKAMGAPVSLLTFKRAVGGGMAAGASASVGRAANCAEDVKIHICKRATGYCCARRGSEKATPKKVEEKVWKV